MNFQPILIISMFVLETFAVSRLPKVLVVSFDGFRRSYLDLGRTPIINNLATFGVTSDYMLPAFPTKTFPNHQSICTGLFPSSHGIVDNEVYDLKYAQKLDGKRYEPGFWNSDENVLPLWILNEQQGGISGALMWPGSQYPYGPNGTLRPTYFYPGYNSSVTWNSRVDTVIDWMTNDEKPANLVFLYFDEPDSTGHVFGPYLPETKEQVSETDKRVGVLIEKLKQAGIYYELNLILLSDHGMEEVTSDRVINLDKYIEKDKFVEDVVGLTPVVQVLPKHGMTDELYKKLSNTAKTSNFKVFRKNELCGSPFYYCEEKERRIHDLIIVADVGWAIDFDGIINVRSKREVTVWGSHGYTNQAASMQAIFIARGPNFKRGYKTSGPIWNVDVVPLISKIIGISGVPTNGSLQRVQAMLSYLED